MVWCERDRAGRAGFLAAALVLLAAAAAPAATAALNVRAYGAAGDGKTLDTAAIQKAIDECARSGGTVLVPAGTFLTGAIQLRSRVTLRLEKDAVLQAASDPALFPDVPSRWEGTEAKYPSPLIYADGCEDVAIEGEGTISALLRAALFRNCRRVRIEGVTFNNRLRWTLHLLYSDGVTVTGCRFLTSGANTDGIDPDSSRDVTIRQCWFRTGDDCIAIKSGKNAEGARVGRPSEDITIADCVMEGGHSAVSIGSEMSGGIRRVTVRNCRIAGQSHGGIRLKTRRGRGGFIEDVTVSDCTVTGSRSAVCVDMQYVHNAGADPIPGEAGIPRLRRIAFVNLSGSDNRAGLEIRGLPESPLEGLRLENVKVSAASAGRIENARDVVWRDVTIEGRGPPLALVNVSGTGVPAPKPDAPK
jgi:polygalacturonase